MTIELLEQVADRGVENLIALVEATLQGKHVHSCFTCGQQFTCTRERPDERLICGECDGEVF